MKEDIILKDENWDFPIYKRLSKNDTGEARGHQGGFVVPKDLRKFFPILTLEPTKGDPTIDHRITAILAIDFKDIAVVDTRYQYQTWGGKRSPEARITDKLGPLRNKAAKDDLLMIQRNLHDINLYRFVLLKKNTEAFNELIEQIGDSRWGVLSREMPLSQNDIDTEKGIIERMKESEFELFDYRQERQRTRARRIARSAVFRETVSQLYSNVCAICEKGLKSPIGYTEIDAAHIVPKKYAGTDDVRNGIALCKQHHWAFDNGLFGIDDQRCVNIPTSVKSLKENLPLLDFAGKPIKEASELNSMASDQSFTWHMKKIVVR